MRIESCFLFLSVLILVAAVPAAFAADDSKISILDVKHTPSSLKTGTKAVLKATMQNNGDAALKNVKVKFLLLSEKYSAFGKYSSIMKDSVIGLPVKQAELDGEAIGEKSIASFPAKQKKTVSITYAVPPGVSVLNIGVVAEDAQATESITVEQLFTELRIANLSSSKQAPVVGDTLSLKAKFDNYGALAAKNAVVLFYASVDGKELKQIGSKKISTIVGKKSGQATLSWKVPAAAAIEIKAVVNPDHAISERNYTDNSAVIRINTSLPDLSVSGSSINITGDFAAGKKVKVSAKVQNVGEADAKNSDVVFYYVSSGGEYVQIGSKKATVKPGASKDLEVQWTVPSDVSSNQVIVVKANPSSSVAESDYSNNQGTYTGTARMADLVVSLTAYNATLSSSPAQSAWMRMDATVRNAGTDAANSIVAKIIYDGQVEKQETIPKLLSGESYQFTSAHRLQYGSQQGQYSFTLEADPDNTVNEADESNNEAAATATATPNRPPVPKITISNTNPAKREWVDFSCAGSTDPDTPWGSPACVWDFGDGSEEVHDQVTFHYFTTSGAHVVRLTAVDSFGLNATVTGTVNVKPNQPPSIAMPSSYSAYKGEESSFSAACHDADGTISSVNWNFGDGSTDTGGCDISHTYSSTGAYAITATAYDESGASAFGSSSVSVVNAPALKTKAFSEVYVAHYSNPQVASSGDGPDAQMFYGLYKVDYEVKYTENDNVIRKVKYSIHSGPGIITAITDNDPEFYFIPLTAASGQGGTAMTVTSVAVQQGSTVLWSVPTYSFLSPAESPLVREFSGLEIPVDWGQHNYFTIQSTIEWPSQMCNWEGYNCQQQTALWAMS